MKGSLSQQLKALLTTPPIVTSKSGFSIFVSHDSFIEIQDEVDIQNLVFGKRMERLFSHYIQHSQRYSLIAENMLIISEGVTLGELDFIIKDRRTKEFIHIEMACKFYIFKPGLSADALQCWVGPNNKDRLADKLSKLKNHQFPLLHHTATRHLLQPLKLSPKNLTQQLFLPGLLFTPKKHQVSLPQINPMAIAGYWLSQSEFQNQDFSGALLHIPAKEDWLTHPQTAMGWLTEKEAKILIMERLEKKKSPMVWLKTMNGSYERFFVLWW